MAYATLVELRSYLGIAAADTDDDVLLARLLVSAQKNIDGYCGWSFEASGAATRYYSPITDTEGDRLVLDMPLLTLTTLTNGDADVITATEYYLEPANTTPKWYVKLRASAGLAWTYTDDHEQAISVAGTWGHMTTADATITQACLRWAGYMYRQKDAQVFDVTAQPGAGIITIPKGMPEDVKMTLSAYRRLC